MRRQTLTEDCVVGCAGEHKEGRTKSPWGDGGEQDWGLKKMPKLGIEDRSVLNMYFIYCLFFIYCILVTSRHLGAGMAPPIGQPILRDSKGFTWDHAFHMQTNTSGVHTQPPPLYLLFHYPPALIIQGWVLDI